MCCAYDKKSGIDFERTSCDSYEFLILCSQPHLDICCWIDNTPIHAGSSPTMIGASLSEPHINGKCVRKLFVIPKFKQILFIINFHNG